VAGVGASDGNCVDPLALTDLAPLARALTAPVSIRSCTPRGRISSAASWGVTRTGPSVFDTRLPPPLPPAPPALCELVGRLVGHELAKTHNPTDWSRRPLSPEQSNPRWTTCANLFASEVAARDSC